MNVDVQFKRYFYVGLIGMVIMSLGKDLVKVKHKPFEILAYPHEELKALTWVEIIYPSDVKRESTEF